MKSQIVIILIITAVTILSCIGKTEYTTPKGENVVPKDSLESMIYDVHLADAIITAKIMKSKNNMLVDSMLYLNVFEKHHYTREQFENTLLYYVHNNMDTLNAMYDRVIARFNAEKGKIY
jgi:hypothetical protein